LRDTEKMPDQYYYTRLQDATQDRGEITEMFADRCRKLCQETVKRVHNAATRTVLNEDAKRRLVATYINGLRGVVGQQIKIRVPSNMDEAVRLAVTVEHAEQRWPSDREDADVECFKCHQRGHMYRDCRNRSYVRPRGGSNPRPLEQSRWTTRRGRGRNPTVSYGGARATSPCPVSHGKVIGDPGIPKSCIYIRGKVVRLRISGGST
jgi:hypothetical protein